MSEKQHVVSSKRLHIAQVVPLWASVPPTSYGGIQLINYYLIQELVERGHKVTLFATGDSKTNAQQNSVCEENLWDVMARREAYQYEYYDNASFAEALASSKSFDVIHSHRGPAKIPFSMLSEVPVLHTMRTALSVDDRWMLQRYPDFAVSAISHSQIKTVPAERRERISVVYNGCDFAAYEPCFEPGKYLAFLGRMGPHKNPAQAIRIAKDVDMPIRLAGQPQTEDERPYFDEHIKPLLNDTDVVYLGPADFPLKNELLKYAAVLLFPIEWEEPFGNVMVEAMACGTPVVACNRGSVSEVIDPGITGFYADSADELAALIPSALALDRATVREHAQQRFSHKKMADEYLKVYRALDSAER